MIPGDRDVQGSDIQDVRELLGVLLVDMTWLLGSIAPRWRTTKAASLQPVDNFPIALIVRLLEKFPEINPIPQMPSFDEMYALFQSVWRDAADIMWPGEPAMGKLSKRRFALLFGTSPYTSNRWNSGGDPRLAIQRLFWIVQLLIERFGANGLVAFLQTVDVQAHAVGVSGGVRDVLRYGYRPARRNQQDDDE